MKNLRFIVIEAHELGVLNSDLLLFFNNFSFSDNNHYETNIEANIVFPSILRIEGFNNNYCYCFKSYYDDINYLFNNYSCIDKQGNSIDQKRYDSLINSYVEGFICGYNNFINSVKEGQIFIGNHEEQSDLIFKRILRPDLQKRGKFEYEVQFLNTQKSDFHSKKVLKDDFQPPSLQIEKIVFDEQKFYECGYGGGEYFKAWEIIFENQKMFFRHFSNVKILENLITNSLVYEQKLNLIFDKDKDGFELNLNHPYYNSNFDIISFRLFMYMLEDYENNNKNKYANIYLVLKEFSKEGKYHFRFTMARYKNYLLEKFKIKITKISKSEFKFEEERSTLLAIESKFRANNL